MSITINDIKRAILCGGSVSTFTEMWRQALGNPPVPIVDSLEVIAGLPEAAALYKHFDSSFEEAMASWAGNRDRQLLPKEEIDLTLVGLAPFGRNIGAYLEQTINQVKPDVIAIDTPPSVLSANMLYAFGIPCALGLPAYGEIMSRDFGQFYAQETFYPGNMNETVIVKSWLSKVPLLPIGVSQKPTQPDSASGYMDGTYIDRLTRKSSLLTAYRALDKNLTGVTNLQDGMKVTRTICDSLMQTIIGKIREGVTEDACYIASRLMEVAAFISTWKRGGRLLAVVDIEHYLDMEYVLDLLRRGITDEVYVPQESYARVKDMVLVGKNRDNLEEEAEEYAPESSLAQELFRSEFDKLVETKNSETLSESEAYRLIAEITSHTRAHPDITRGASVRGAIAFAEILGSLPEMDGGLIRDNISRAALITLPPRISLRQKGDAVAVVSDIVKEALYDISFSIREEEVLSRVFEQLSGGDIMKSIDKLGQILPEQNSEMTRKELPAIVADTSKNRELSKYLEGMKSLQGKSLQNQHSFTKKALEYLMSELERKLKAGEITPDEYNRGKARLTEMLQNASRPQFRMAGKELANTIMEMMDAQDKQWSREVSFEAMHVYYHIKANSEGAELSPEKRDYYGLKMLIDSLEKQQILSVSEKAHGFTLTATALNILLRYLIDNEPEGREFRGTIGSAKALTNERDQEIRRYSTGDVFRDISIRHTLKEIAKQRKGLASVRRSDFRVFLRQRRKPHSDIVLCMDISGSMGFQHKLMYARLAAAALVQAAERGDRIGMVAFNDSGQFSVPLTEENKDILIDYIAGLSARGNTNIGDGIKCSSQLLFQNHSRNQKYIILITDGQPTAISEGVFTRLKASEKKDLTEESALLETRQAVARGGRVSVIHVATRGEASGEFIRNIARVGKGKVRRISSADDLKAILH